MPRKNWKTKECPTCKIPICYNSDYCRPHVPRTEAWKKRISEKTGEARRKMFKEGTLVAPRGDKHPCWKGGRTKNNQGYFFLYAEGHPHAQPTTGRVAEHRLVMEKKIGRYLTPDEEVHHINGIRDDNRIENLQLMDGGEHARLHAIGKYKIGNKFAKKPTT